MYKLIALVTSAVLLLQLLTVSAIAQVVVPVEQEPMHRIKFENEFVRLFDVLIPVGKKSKYHTHLNDGVSVRLSNTRIVDEVLGGGKTTFEIKYGDATFGPRPSPLSHRVVNSSKSDFRNIFIDILPRKDLVKDTLFPILTDAHVVLIDNSRVRVNRLVLKPGESSKVHTHPMHGLGILLYDSKIEITSPGSAVRVLELMAGDFAWQNAGTTHMIKNIGSTVFEVIDIEFK